MKFNAGTRTRILWDVTLTIDPTGSTLEVRIDDDWHPADWLDDPVEGSEVIDDELTKVWKQTAQTTGWFAGPDVADPAGATVLSATTGSPAGRHRTKIRVTSGDDVITDDAESIDVG